MRVAKHLDFDVAGALHIFLDQHRVIAKAVAGFALARGQGGFKINARLNDAHAFATATGAGLDQHRVTDAVGFTAQQCRVLIGPVVARHQRHTGLLHQALGLGLEAHGQNARRLGPDEDDARIGTGLSKCLVLAQETIARVDRLRPGVAGGL